MKNHEKTMKIHEKSMEIHEKSMDIPGATSLSSSFFAFSEMPTRLSVFTAARHPVARLVAWITLPLQPVPSTSGPKNPSKHHRFPSISYKFQWFSIDF